MTYKTTTEGVAAEMQPTELAADAGVTELSSADLSQVAGGRLRWPDGCIFGEGSVAKPLGFVLNE